MVDTAHIILIDNNGTGSHIYCFQENKWYCETCEKACKVKSIINSLHEHISPPVANNFNPKTESKSISSTHIPFTLPLSLSKIYKEQLLSGLYLPNNLYPEDLLQRCPYGYGYLASNVKLEQTGIIVYLENEVREYKLHNGIVICIYY